MNKQLKTGSTIKAQQNNIIFEHESYREIVVKSTGEVQLIECVDGNTVKLYRIEFVTDGMYSHIVRYTYDFAVATYEVLALGRSDSEDV